MTEKQLFKMDRMEIRRMMPKRGYGKKIAEIAGVSQQCVCAFWKGDSNNIYVMRAIIDVLKEVEKVEIEIDRRAKEIMALRHGRTAKM